MGGGARRRTSSRCAASLAPGCRGSRHVRAFPSLRTNGGVKPPAGRHSSLFGFWRQNRVPSDGIGAVIIALAGDSLGVAWRGGPR